MTRMCFARSSPEGRSCRSLREQGHLIARQVVIPNCHLPRSDLFFTRYLFHVITRCFPFQGRNSQTRVQGQAHVVLYSIAVELSCTSFTQIKIYRDVGATNGSNSRRSKRLHVYQHFAFCRRGLSDCPMIGVNFSRSVICVNRVKKVKKARNSTVAHSIDWIMYKYSYTASVNCNNHLTR